MIDIKENREAYNDDIIDNIIWISRNSNLAHALTKRGVSANYILY